MALRRLPQLAAEDAGAVAAVAVVVAGEPAARHPHQRTAHLQQMARHRLPQLAVAVVVAAAAAVAVVVGEPARLLRRLQLLPRHRRAL
jgi:hypothetical protein